MAVDGAVDNVTGHQFGQAGGVTLLVFITGGQDLTGGVVHQHPGTGRIDGGVTVTGKSAAANAQETLEASKVTANKNGLSTAYPQDLQIRRPFTEVRLRDQG